MEKMEVQIRRCARRGLKVTPWSRVRPEAGALAGLCNLDHLEFDASWCQKWRQKIAHVTESGHLSWGSLVLVVDDGGDSDDGDVSTAGIPNLYKLMSTVLLSA